MAARGLGPRLACPTTRPPPIASLRKEKKKESLPLLAPPHQCHCPTFWPSSRSSTTQRGSRASHCAMGRAVCPRRGAGEGDRERVGAKRRTAIARSPRRTLSLCFFFFAPLPSTPSTPPTPTMLTIRAAARPAPMVAARPAVRRAAARGVVLARADPKSPLEAAIDEAKETCADGSTSECAVAWDTVRVRRKMGGVERERGRENCLARPLHCVGGGWAGRAAGRGAACRPSPPPPSPTFFPEGECACAASSARARRPRALQMPAHARAQGRTRARLGLGVGGPRPDPPVRPPFPPRAGCLAHTARPPLARSLGRGAALAVPRAPIGGLPPPPAGAHPPPRRRSG